MPRLLPLTTFLKLFLLFLHACYIMSFYGLNFHVVFPFFSHVICDQIQILRSYKPYGSSYVKEIFIINLTEKRRRRSFRLRIFNHTVFWQLLCCRCSRRKGTHKYYLNTQRFQRHMFKSLGQLLSCFLLRHWHQQG